MVENRVSPADELQRAAEILFKDWKLALPTAIASLILVGTIFFVIFGAIGTAIIGTATGGHSGLALGVGTGLLAVALFLPFAFALVAFANGIVVAGSADAWEGRAFDFSRSWVLVRAHAGDLLVALVATSIGFAVFGLLSLLLIGLPFLIALAYFTMYVQPAILLGGESVVTAFGTSFRLAKTFTSESIVAFLGVIAAAVAGNILNGFVVHVPGLNLVAGFAIGGFTAAFGALVSARFYTLLRDATPQNSAFAYAPAQTPAEPEPPASPLPPTQPPAVG